MSKVPEVRLSDQVISPQEAGTLPGLFKLRLERTPDALAYRQYDEGSRQWVDASWSQMAIMIGSWQQAMRASGLEPGQKVAVMLRNCKEWVAFDQAAMGLGLITVPLYMGDRPDNVAYITANADVKLLLVEGREQWEVLLNEGDGLPSIKWIVSLAGLNEEEKACDSRLISLTDWIGGRQGEFSCGDVHPNALASIVYTSGTTGRPKGVMLSHRNILSNTWFCVRSFEVRTSDIFLSFLPLSHMFERTCGYYLTIMAGAKIVFNRSISLLAEDMQIVKPTVLISVPRIYERVYGRIMAGLKQKNFFARVLFQLTVNIGWRRFEYQQKRAAWSFLLCLWPLLEILISRKVVRAMGGCLRVAICGGAPLPENIAHLFIGLGLPILQGYGLTESSPVISVNRLLSNIPSSIGPPVPDVEVRIGKDDELQARSDSVMLGYWADEKATRATFTDDGWLRTGDKARIDHNGHIYITGRIKEILVLGNGEKIPPADMEMAISVDPLFEQVMVVGEARRFLLALIVLEPGEWRELATRVHVDPDDALSLESDIVKKAVLQRITARIKMFPGYAQVRAVHLSLQPWTVEGGLLTPTLKLKRSRILQHHQDIIAAIYAAAEDR